MKTFTATAAKQKFGHVVREAMVDIVKVTKDGTDSVYILSAETFLEFQNIKRELLELKLAQAYSEQKSGTVQSLEDVEARLMSKFE